MATTTKLRRTKVADRWLDISSEGFAAENAGREYTHLTKELVQNALDAIGEDAGRVEVEIKPAEQGRGIEITVTDNGKGISADQLLNVRTVFWTNKQDSVLKRGRMGRGFKEMLCLAKEATVHSGSAQLRFQRDGKKESIYREAASSIRGTVVHMVMPWPKNVIPQLETYFATFLIPENINLFVNGTLVGSYVNKYVAATTLPTEQFEQDRWTRPSRATTVELIGARSTPMLYEMGIPVCELEWDFPYHANVHQRIPLNPKRDAPATGYVRKVHAAAIPLLLPELSKEQILSDVVGAAAPMLDETTQRAIIERGLGTDIVREVPLMGRRDFNDDASDLGYRPINTAQLSGGLRDIVRQFVPSARDVVANHQLREHEMAVNSSFSLEGINAAFDAADTEARQRQQLIRECGGKERVQQVAQFALWVCQQLFRRYPEATLTGVRLGVMEPTVIAAWGSDNQLSLNLRYARTFREPLGPESLSTYVHEVAHFLNFSHNRNFHKEIETLSGQLGAVMFEQADTIRSRWPELVG